MKTRTALHLAMIAAAAALFAAAAHSKLTGLEAAEPAEETAAAPAGR